ncbi:MAG: MATE family efflux transporter, partial [Firmicutes bacterium]|nr:MATE family efflux transporter [Bacillota bacterium]
LRAAGDVTFTMIVCVVSMWLFRIGCAYFMGQFLGMGLIGVWVAMIIDWAVRTVFFIARYKSGKWKKGAVV